MKSQPHKRDRDLNASLPYHLRDDVPPLGYCSWCHRKTWSEAEGEVCEVPQPDGIRCPGVIVKWPASLPDRRIP